MKLANALIIVKVRMDKLYVSFVHGYSHNAYVSIPLLKYRDYIETSEETGRELDRKIASFRKKMSEKLARALEETAENKKETVIIASLGQLEQQAVRPVA